MHKINNLNTRRIESILYKLFLVLILALSNHVSAHAQSSLNNASITKGKIYALIIGISNYRDDNIKDLKYAHRDAELFAAYLSSPAGGLVPSERIKLLTNEDATISNIYIAKQWLEEVAKKDDLVFFYFSGHGDVESSVYKLGFLLAYDTPFKNYLNNAVRIEDINIMANTLSIQKSVNTILITDACHSGKLAGSDDRGAALVGEQLSTVEKNEIRIASCEADQLSEEDEIWGGGRGVFSYYLINGMKGLADAGDEDGIVTLQELRTYIELKVSTDVSNLKEKEQIPVVKGKNLSKVAIVDDDELTKVKAIGKTGSEALTLNGDKSVDFKLQIADQYFNALYTSPYIKIKNEINFSDWNKKSNEEVIQSAIQQFGNPLGDSEAFNEWRISLNNQEVSRRDYGQRLAALIHSDVQKTINAYLAGDKEEMQRRQYYNAQDRDYDEYQDMIEVAMKLINKNSHLYHILEVKYHYFKGVAARLNAVLYKNADSLFNIAFIEQNKALALESKAAYIVNELGSLSAHKKDYTKAKSYFEKAIEMVPGWSIPRSNLSNIYFILQQYNSGIEEAQKAIALQENYPASFTNLGRNAEAQKNYLLAEEGFRKAIKYDDKNYLPFEQLAQLYITMGKYSAADDFFSQAEARKSGSINNIALPLYYDTESDISFHDRDTIATCKMKTSDFGSEDVMAFLVYGYENFLRSNYPVAKEYYLKAIKVDPRNPIAFRYLGELMYKQNKWLEAELYFDIAQRNYTGKDSFNVHVKKTIKTQKYKDCNIEVKYENLYYDQVECYYFLGDIYTEWSYYAKAASYYKRALNIKAQDFAPYALLWQLYEKQGRYLDAELMIQAYSAIEKNISNNELLAFYKRRIDGKKNAETYKYKAANLLYGMCQIEEDADFDLEVKEEKIKAGEELKAASPKPAGGNKIPGTNKILQQSEPISLPNSGAIDFFLSMLPTKNRSLQAETYYKLAELYSLKSLREESAMYYRMATNLLPNDASLKRKLTIKYIKLFENSNALKELSYLYETNSINFNGLLLFAKYCIYAGQYEKGEVALKRAEMTYPYPLDFITETRAIKCLYAEEYDNAILAYKNMIKPGNENNKNIYYTLCRLYALKSNKDQAFSYLSEAIKSGFNYFWVLNKDVATKELRKSDKWDSLH